MGTLPLLACRSQYDWHRSLYESWISGHGVTKPICVTHALGGRRSSCSVWCFLLCRVVYNFSTFRGEYHFLTRIYHPLLGSWQVGFPSPQASPLLLLWPYFLGSYTQAFIGVGTRMFWGVSAILLMAFTHCIRIQCGARVQDRLTVLKILLIMVFIGAGLPLVRETLHLSLTRSV